MLVVCLCFSVPWCWECLYTPSAVPYIVCSDRCRWTNDFITKRMRMRMRYDLQSGPRTRLTYNFGVPRRAASNYTIALRFGCLGARGRRRASTVMRCAVLHTSHGIAAPTVRQHERQPDRKHLQLLVVHRACGAPDKSTQIGYCNNIYVVECVTDGSTEHNYGYSALSVARLRAECEQPCACTLCGIIFLFGMNHI